MKRLLHPLIFLLAVVLVFEEWLWDTLKAQLQRLSHLPMVARAEAALRTLPPAAALVVLVVPGLVLIPFKVGALYLMAHQHPMLGLVVLLAAKLTGTAIAAYLFDLVRDNARKLRWFDALYRKVSGVFTTARAWLHAQPSYQWAREQAQQMRRAIRALASRPSRLTRKLGAAKVLARRNQAPDQP